MIIIVVMGPGKFFRDFPGFSSIPGILQEFGGAGRLGNRGADRMELVVSGHLLGQNSTSVILEHDEITD